MFLTNYDLTLNEKLLSIFTISGIPYSQRHWELSEKCDPKYAWGHRFIAILEATPLIGGLIALIERIICFVKETFMNKSKNAESHSPLNQRVEQLKNEGSEPAKESNWKPQAAAVDATFQRMFKNSEKAIKEHKNKSPAYASLESLPSIEEILNCELLPPLTFSHYLASTKGIRREMEDTHFFQETDRGIITGVLDGHGGSQVAEYSKEAFQKRFFNKFREKKEDVHCTFDSLIDEIHKEVANNEAWNCTGTTAVLCFIDKKTHQIYSATLGDSEANIYRKINGELKSIPISCVRDWSSQSEAERASLALNNPSIKETWPCSRDPKSLRYPSPEFGLNVSRAIGDVEFSGTPDKPAVIHKAKITINKLKSGDTLILGSDGLKDYVAEHEIVNTIDRHQRSENLANKLKDLAMIKLSKDNVTVVTIKVN